MPKQENVPAQELPRNSTVVKFSATSYTESVFALFDVFTPQSIQNHLWELLNQAVMSEDNGEMTPAQRSTQLEWVKIMCDFIRALDIIHRTKKID